MLTTLIAIITKLVVTLVVVIAFLWVLIARPMYSPGAGASDDKELVDSAVLRAHVEALSTRYVPRSFNYPDNLNKVAAYIAEHLEAYGARVTEQAFNVDDTRYKNIIAEFGPESRSVVIVGAHYDAAGEYPGANDNASGVAGLLELGRLLADENLSGRVVLVAFTLEEPPFYRTEHMGSAIYAKSISEKGTDVELMISLEMIGYFTDDKDSQGYPAPLLKLFYPSAGNFIAVVDRVFSTQAMRLKKTMSDVSRVPVYSINAPASLPGVDFSDHMNFWRYGYPAVMITDTAFYRSDAYHSPKDTSDRLNYRKMGQVVYGVYRHIVKLQHGE